MFVKATTIVSLFALAAQQVAADASAKDINVVKAHFERELGIEAGVRMGDRLID